MTDGRVIEFVEQGRPEYGPPAPVQIIQEEVEFAQLLGLYRKREPKRVLEVGTYTGGTFFHWLQNAPSGATVVSVDLYEDVDNSDMYTNWCAPGVMSVVIRGDSRDEKTLEAARVFEPYDWIFIDGGHRYEEVSADWENYRPMAAPGAVVAFHDIAVDEEVLPSIQVGRLWKEIKAEHETREFVDGGSGIGVVFF